MARVLITDGEQRASLALVRSLGMAGYEPFVCSARPRSLAGASRFARDEAVTPDPLRDPEGFVHALRALADRWNPRVLIPVTEPSLLAVLGARARFAGIEIPFPELEAFRRICDKRAVLDAARAVGIATPAQVSLDTPEDARSKSLARVGFPVVIKPARSVAEEDGHRLKLGVTYAADAHELWAKLQNLPRAAFPVLLQQRVVGPGVGVFLLVWHGETLASFAHRRIREKPPSGGVSVYRESIPADPVLVQRSRTLLDRFGWHGVAMVEYKLDAATGTPYLMEINGRFWGSLQLAIDAGADFPSVLVRAALGERVQPRMQYRSGVRSRWWWGDVDQILTRLRRSPEALELPPDSPTRLRSVFDFLTLWRAGDRNEVFRWRDPIPFVRETIDWFARR